MKYIYLSLLILTSAVVKADDSKGLTFSVGYGTPNLTVALFDIFDNGENQFKTSGFGPIHFKGEARLKNWFGAGLNVNFVSYDIQYVDKVLDEDKGTLVPNNVRIKGSNTAFNFRGNFYFTNPDKQDNLDVYWGLGLGLRFGKPKLSSDYEYYSPSVKLPNFSVIGFETTFGIRYFPIENVGIYTEVGLAKSILQGGISLRF